MNVQTHPQKSRGRLAELSPFDPELEESVRTAEHAGRQGKRGEVEPEEGAAYGCVEWFYYPSRTPAPMPGRSGKS